jgi:pyruvate/2-oxoglutarate dehydrogenase complex dihydrolipoamide dehydrogenase (E3) component
MIKNHSPYMVCTSVGDTKKLSSLLIPWCTYTDPEIAHVGKYERDCEQENIEYEVYRRNLGDVDRCICDGITEGFVKIICKKGSYIVIVVSNVELEMK